ncbi:unnamed protein product [Ascophyllum nodosum]
MFYNNCSSSSSSDQNYHLESAFAQIRADLTGRLQTIETPFGSKPLVYADWTASGRSLKSIERFMSEKVMPLYANTHTTTSMTGAQTTAFREEARRVIAQSVNAKSEGGPDDDVVLFVGSGTTGAVNKVISALSLDRKKRSWTLSKKNRAVVFIGPFEHHSNILPWRESYADVVQISENAAGGVNADDLESKLKQYAARNLKIGSFAAASNLTGALEDTDIITEILHRGGALSFWDYATAAPYVKIDMNPNAPEKSGDQLLAKDAIFISGHKFLGGPGTPGVLVCKKKLFMDSSPGVPGGGTVLFVTSTDHAYISNIEEREEGGTPEILGAIRLGLVFQLKNRLGSLEEREEMLTKFGLAKLRAHPRVVLIGDTGRRRLPIFSFLIRHGYRFLHHSFVCKLLNDLFGVQARAGCQCAGPYHTRLLGISDTEIPKVKQHVLNTVGIIKPGSCRLSLAFFMSDAEVEYILDAILFIADYGSCFLPQYEPNVTTGEWTHKDFASGGALMQSLADLTYGFDNAAADDNVVDNNQSDDPGILPLLLENERAMPNNVPVKRFPNSEEDILAGQMSEARRLAAHVCMARSRPSSSWLGTKEAPKEQGNVRMLGNKLGVVARPTLSGFKAHKSEWSTLSEAAEALRWFSLPADLASVRSIAKGETTRPIIIPKVYNFKGLESKEK